jgi:predicted DNA-binding transcriptional regulator YafY
MKRASTQDRLQRLELLTARVKSENPTTIGDVAKEFGVSIRTINRDIQILRNQGLPIDADRGRGGGVRLHHSWGIGRINLNYAEAVDLLVSLAVAEQMNSPLFMAQLTNIRHKLMASFSPSMSHKVKGLKARIQIGESSSSTVLSTYTPAAAPIVGHLHQAFLMQQSSQITYWSMNDEKTKRVIQPHYLLLCSPVWYVLAWDELRNDVRTFRCDRIQKINVRDESFKLLPISRFKASLEGINAI